MNLKIEGQTLRFKISRAELSTLLEGQKLYEKTLLAGSSLEVTVDPTGEEKSMQPVLVIEKSTSKVGVLIPPRYVQALADMGRSKKGIEQTINGVSISLQVDLREHAKGIK